MLKVKGDGVVVTLNSKEKVAPSLGFAFGLIIIAIAAGVGMVFLPQALAFLALFLLAVVCFIFNFYRQKSKKSSPFISSGSLEVYRGKIIHDDGATQKSITIDHDDTIKNTGSVLIICDKNQQKKCHIVGFDHGKEVEVIEKVLKGSGVSKQYANITIKPD